MQESNFEKQVQQKMDELTLNPSGGVWQKVADTIEKRKGIRRVNIIVLLILLFIGSTVFILLNQSAYTKFDKSLSDKIMPQKADDIKESKSGNNIPDEDVASAISNNDGENSKVGKAGLPGNALGSKTKRARQIQIPTLISANSARQLTTSKNISIRNEKKVKVGVGNKSNSINYNTRKLVKMNVSSAEPEELSEEINPFVDNDRAVVLGEEIKTDRQITDTLNKGATDIGKLSTDTIAVIQKLIEEKKVDIEKAIQLKLKTKWEIGFNFSLGFAATKSSYLGIIGLGSADESKALDPAQSNAGAGSGAGITIPYTPSKIKPGAGISMGVFIQKRISPKSNLQLGLNYKSYNSSMQIGNRVDSSLSFGGNLFNRDNFFYRAGTKGNYKNHFHFIELPVSMRIKLGKQNKLPVYLNSGFTISQLITTNALQFEALSGSYYRDNAAFNKTQFNISAGLLISLSRNTKNPFLIGPDLNFSLTKMANSGIYKNRHYSFIGIQLRKGIGKK